MDTTENNRDNDDDRDHDDEDDNDDYDMTTMTTTMMTMTTTTSKPERKLATRRPFVFIPKKSSVAWLQQSRIVSMARMPCAARSSTRHGSP